MIQSLFAIYLQTAGRLNADYQKKTMKNPQNKVLAISSRFLRLNKFNQNLFISSLRVRAYTYKSLLASL